MISFCPYPSRAMVTFCPYPSRAMVTFCPYPSRAMVTFCPYPSRAMVTFCPYPSRAMVTFCPIRVARWFRRLSLSVLYERLYPIPYPSHVGLFRVTLAGLGARARGVEKPSEAARSA